MGGRGSESSEREGKASEWAIRILNDEASLVDVPDKEEGGPPSNGPEHEEETKADHEHIAKEEGRLHEAAHLGLELEV